MADKPEDAGVQAGLEGKESKDNPYERTIGGSIFDDIAEIAGGGSVKEDKDAWEAGRQHGESLRKK